MSLADRLRRYRKKHLPKRKRKYVRIYGRFRSTTGLIKGFEFQVRVSDKLSNKALYKLITYVCGKIKNGKMLPYHKRRETFPSFYVLFHVPWIRIKEILDYDVKMDYPTPF